MRGEKFWKKEIGKMIEEFKTILKKGLHNFLFNIRLNFSRNTDVFKSMDLQSLFQSSFLSVICIQIVILVLSNILYLYGFEMYRHQNMTNEALVELKQLSYTIYLLNHYPLNQLIALFLVSCYLSILIISFKIANFVIGEPSLDWRIASFLGFTSFLPWQFTMFSMNISTSYFFTNKFLPDHWFRQIFVSFNSYLLLISFLLSFYFVIKNAGIVTKLNLRKRILISIFPCIIFIVLVGLLTLE